VTIRLTDQTRGMPRPCIVQRILYGSHPQLPATGHADWSTVHPGGSSAGMAPNAQHSPLGARRCATSLPPTKSSTFTAHIAGCCSCSMQESFSCTGQAGRSVQHGSSAQSSNSWFAQRVACGCGPVSHAGGDAPLHALTGLQGKVEVEERGSERQGQSTERCTRGRRWAVSLMASPASESARRL
jgi:hypothetical protein